MNNPPDISQDPKEYEEYAHGIQKHVRGYLMVGALLLTFTVITVALSYVHFGTRQGQHCNCHAGGHDQGGRRCRGFHASGCGKTPHLPHSDFHRLFCDGPLLAYITGVVRLSDLSLNVP